ncbi:MAG: hypothetical protein QM817_07130 [Archangium sp.]
MTDLDPLPNDLQALLQLFSSLPDVRFPDLDAAGLQASVARVKERQLELAALEAQREAVRAELEEQHEALLRRGHRLHSYLKVFAEHDEALAAKVNALVLPKMKRTAVVATEGDPAAPAPKKRGRPRKVPATDALFPQEQHAPPQP